MDKISSTSQLSNRHSIKHLLLSERLKESGSPKIILASIILLFVIFVALIFWSILVQIDEVAKCTGEIVPYDEVKSIQHLEGGIVHQVFVKDNDLVNKGDKLFILEADAANADLKRYKKRQNSSAIEIFRLMSLLNTDNLGEGDIDQEAFKQVIPYKDVTPPEMLNLQVANAYMFYQQQRQQKIYNRHQLRNRLEQEKQNLLNIEKQLYHFEQRKKVVEDEVNMYSALNKQQATSTLDLLDKKDHMYNVINDYLQVVRDKTAVGTTVMELEKEMRNLEYQQENIELEELNKATSELLENKEQVAIAQDKVDRLLLVAPVDGMVKGIKINPGAVIKPAEDVFDIVPIKGPVIATVKISTKDIGHVHIGDPVEVKVDTYDFSVYGQVYGHLESYSGTTYLDPKQNPYFEGTIYLDKNYIGNNPKANLIFPGMTINVGIKTSKKSLFKYLIKPLNRTFHNAFKER